MTTALLARRERPAPAGAGPGSEFYLGSHCACWLWDGTISYPLFISARQLQRYKKLRSATVPSWAVDSGGFTELSAYGTWRTGPLENLERDALILAA